MLTLSSSNTGVPTCSATPTAPLNADALQGISQAILNWEQDHYTPARAHAIVIQPQAIEPAQPNWFERLVQGACKLVHAATTLLAGSFTGFGVALSLPSAALDAWNGLCEAASGIWSAFLGPQKEADDTLNQEA
jgi:hypothetical protein